jgi:hypothetical protein
MKMRGFLFAAAALATSIAAPANACRMYVPLNVTDVQYASTVVIGRVSNYRIVLDADARKRRDAALADNPGMRSDVRQRLESQTSFLSDYARFDVIVDQLLVGTAPKVVSVTWNNSTFGEPESMPPGPYLIALRAPGSAVPPLRGPSATILSTPEPALPTLLQAPCSSAFIFPVASDEAVAVRKIIAG